MEKFSSWLNEIIIKGYHLGIIAENHNPKVPDNSLAQLVELLEQGYDRVEWMGSDRDKESGEICQHYDSNRTTWDLASFLNIAKESSENSDINIIAASFDEMSEEEKLKIVSNPASAYRYAKKNRFQDIPLEITDVIAEDVGWTEAFINGFLNNNIDDEIPAKMISTIIQNLTTEADFIAHILHYFGTQDNVPERFRNALGDSSSADSMIQENPSNIGDPNLMHNAPIYEHSHVGCNCFLAVYKSDDPSDVVFVGKGGRI